MNSRSKTRTTPQPLRLRLKEEARNAILDAAEQVLAEQGLRAARMDDIATRVGVSVGTLYNYFEDRQKLLEALWDKQGRELLERLDAELERGEGSAFRERLNGFVHRLVEHAQAHLPLFTVMMEPPPGESVEVRAQDVVRTREQLREVSLRLTRLCEQGVREGALRPEDAAYYPLLVLGLVRTVLFQRIHAHQPLDIEGLSALVLRCFLEGAAPRPR